MVDAVICVQSDLDDRFSTRPVLARTTDEVLVAKGVKPTLSPNLNTLALVELSLFIMDDVRSRNATFSITGPHIAGVVTSDARSRYASTTGDACSK
ncbi:hypothetical protein QYF36_009834 [Acer negundo]|nr:hypothetical protein QYF36_009834 [Acer negundo]